MIDIYIESNDGTLGPSSPEQVRQLLSEGKIAGDAAAWYKNGASRGTVAEIVDRFFPPPKPLDPEPKRKGRGWLGCILLGIALVLCVPCCMGPVGSSHRLGPRGSALQTAHAIDLALFMYSSDHKGAYLDGKTSTEVFQKLVDGQYIYDPGFFYLPMPGKTKATAKTLTAANDCFDYTAGVTADSSGDVPLVFLTGYTVTYAPGARAMRDASAATPFDDGIAVGYKNNTALFLASGPEGTVSAFVPETFDPGKQTYRQLRP